MGVDFIKFQEGAIRFAGCVRGGDEAGHDVLEVNLPSYPPRYGEYRPKWAENGNDFDIEIVSFGYAYRENVGNPHIAARLRFSSEQSEIIQRLITGLILSPEAHDGISPFSSKKARFLGHVHFLQGWIIKDG